MFAKTMKVYITVVRSCRISFFKLKADFQSSSDTVWLQEKDVIIADTSPALPLMQSAEHCNNWDSFASRFPQGIALS